MKIKYLFFLLIFFISGCSQSEKEAEPFADCKYGQPFAIFKPDLPQVNHHQFTISNSESTEITRFNDGLELTLIQTGCDTRKQEFQFKLSGSYQEQKPEFWVEATLDFLQKLGRLGPDYQVFNAWAEALALQSESIRLAQPLEVQPGFYVRIDKILSQDHAILLLILSEKP